jgi:hypothetical protein
MSEAFDPMRRAPGDEVRYRRALDATIAALQDLKIVWEELGSTVDFEPEAAGIQWQVMDVTAKLVEARDRMAARG